MLTIEVPEALEADLVAGAARAAMPVADDAGRALAMGLVPELPPLMTGAELVRSRREDGWIGSLPADTDPVALSRELRDRAQTRDWE